MPTLRIIEALDIVEHVCLCIAALVPDIAGSAHRAGWTCFAVFMRSSFIENTLTRCPRRRQQATRNNQSASVVLRLSQCSLDAILLESWSSAALIAKTWLRGVASQGRIVIDV